MKLTGKHYGIILVTLATAFLHLSLLSLMGLDPIVLNGLGYLGLLGAYFLPDSFFEERRIRPWGILGRILLWVITSITPLNHKFFWWALTGYTVLTIVLWILLGDKQFVAGTSSAIGYYAKTAEVILLAFLWADKPKS